MKLAVTGHRPEKLLGYSEPAFRRVTLFASLQLQQLKPKLVITGMALGWDIAVAEACCTLGIPFIAAVPFVGQESRWQTNHRLLYRDLLRCAKRVEVISKGGYETWKMQKRNQWMVNKAKKIIALWDGSTGGTSSCVRYAQAQKKEVINVWKTYQRISPYG